MIEKFAIAIHGGAFQGRREYPEEDAFLRTVLDNARAQLRQRISALDVAVEAVRRLEDCGLFVAGKGSGPNNAGYYELDASVMNGHDGRAGSVASLRRFKNPILCARRVMEHTPHVLLVADGAEHFLQGQGMEMLPDPHAYFVPVVASREQKKNPSIHGTVGAVVLDTQGNLASAVSTGGISGKFEGRAGDVPLIGAAIYADQNQAICSTGHGEFFIRTVAAHDVASQCNYGGVALKQALENTLEKKIRVMGGWGGMIAVNKDAKVAMHYACTGMHRGFVTHDQDIFTGSL